MSKDSLRSRKYRKGDNGKHSYTKGSYRAKKKETPVRIFRDWKDISLLKVG